MTSVGLTFVVICALASICGVAQAKGKYAESANTQDNVSDRFRTRVVQQVWEKAHRMNFPPKKLEELSHVLQQHDVKMLQLKKHQQDGGDPEGETEALLRRRLSDIMRKFGIIPPEGEDPRRAKDFGQKRDMTGEEFKDHRLNKLWMKAQQSPNFNTLELDQLKEELTHHQEKVNQFEQLSSQLYSDRTRDANRVDRDKKTMDPDERSVLELDLKIQHRELTNDFQRLSSKLVPDQHKGEFQEPRVVNLWREALFANFTEEELESISTELKHFEAKLTKFEDLQVQSLHAEKEYRVAKKLGETTDAKKHKSLRDEARELGNSVHTFMNDMRGRIQRNRDRADEL
ncbi:alpha-2-macroglobulin receptor-associated protein-like [Acanthaster planci]|uniref:Alpha-2-macroglobulin receptor-associated protein-like n=1 Tax=Acanthaster planci TaxID=133434 RepID=A0A8B7Y4P6_ACAPL|nr:alpha-2-macroglobulin receptor-associated protein-like [Acanthaster planci]